MAGVTLKHISKIYPSRDKHHGEGVRAVDNFNMEIDDNEFIVPPQRESIKDYRRIL